MYFIFYEKIHQRGQSLVEFILAFAVIASLTVFAGTLFRSMHTSGGGGSLDRHHQTAMNLIIGEDIPPIADLYPSMTPEP